MKRKREAETEEETNLHKELIAQYEIHKGVEQALKDIIIEAVDEDYLLEMVF